MCLLERGFRESCHVNVASLDTLTIQLRKILKLLTGHSGWNTPVTDKIGPVTGWMEWSTLVLGKMLWRWRQDHFGVSKVGSTTVCLGYRYLVRAFSWEDLLPQGKATRNKDLCIMLPSAGEKRQSSDWSNNRTFYKDQKGQAGKAGRCWRKKPYLMKSTALGSNFKLQPKWRGSAKADVCPVSWRFALCEMGRIGSSGIIYLQLL